MSKLIVEMEMPSICFECFARLSCERYTQELEMVDNLEVLRAILPNDKCLIKGELVRCGECKHRKPPTDYCEKLCKAYVPDDFYCKYGERKEKENADC